jgi:uncharacterized membrane protein
MGRAREARSMTRRGRGPWSETVAAERDRRAQKVRGLQDDERFDRLRTPGARRGLVVAGYVAAVVAGGLAWADPQGPVAVAAPVVFLLAVGVAFLLNRVARHMTEADDELLDERAVALRDRAFHRSYPVLTFGALGGLLALMLGLGDDVAAHHLQALFYTYGAVAMLTPVTLLVWHPDEL